MKDDPFTKIAYNVYLRIRTEELYKPTTEQERLQASEVVLDLAEVPFVREKKQNTVIQKLRISDD